MPDQVIPIFGRIPSYSGAAGEPMALVASADCLVDRERGRARIAAIPGPSDLERWVGPAELLLAARAGVWGLELLEDNYPRLDPPPLLTLGSARYRGRRAPRERVPGFGRSVRASIPRDVCSCLRCRDLVIARRDRRTGLLSGLVAPGRLFDRAARLVGVTACQGPGAANVTHGLDCPAWKLEQAGPIVPGRGARAGLLCQLLRLLEADQVGAHRPILSSGGLR